MSAITNAGMRPHAGGRTQVWIANVPTSWTAATVKQHLCRNGFGAARNVDLSSDTGLWRGGTQYGIVTFRSEASATIFRASGENRRALFWPDGRRAVITLRQLAEASSLVVGTKRQVGTLPSRHPKGSPVGDF